MAKYRAIPQGFMTVGEVAKKMGVTVRTLQYYDKEGLRSPSAESEGGRRLYTDKDLITLHQIISLKSLGFSLEDIKQRLISLGTPADVANARCFRWGSMLKCWQAAGRKWCRYRRRGRGLQLQSFSYLICRF